MKARSASRAGALVLAAAVLSCGPARDARTGAFASAASGREVSPSGVPLTIVERDGDPATGVALAVAATGTGDSEVIAAAALSGVLERRLRARGVADATASAGAEGYRIRANVTTPEDVRAFVSATFAALAAPITEEDLPAARVKVAAVLALPLVSATEEPVARCLGAPRVAARPQTELDVATLEAMRARSHVRSRVALAVVGSRPAIAAMSDALARVPALATDPSPPRDARTAVAPFAMFDAESTAKETHAIVVRQFGSPLDALAAAERLEASPMAARIAAIDGGVRVRDITATAALRGGCLAIDMSFSDLGKSPGEIVARGLTIAEEEIELVVGLGFAAKPDDRAVRRIPDVGVAAEAAAWLSLSSETTEPAQSFTRVAPASARTRELPADELEAALAAARKAQKTPVVEVRGKVEHGQGELWLFLGSPCGTMLESNADAGVTSAALSALAPDGGPTVFVEPITTPDAVGLLVHGAPLPGEPPLVHARRLADVAARPFLGDPVQRERAEAALRRGFAVADGDETRALAELAALVSPGHLSWLVPTGAPDPLGRASDVAIGTKVSALRHGPIRLAVLANDSDEQTRTAGRAVDRWLPSRGEARACEPLAPPESEHPGTYAASRLAPGPSEVLVSVQVPDARSYALAEAWVALLAGPDGLLAKALGTGLARESSARLLGSPRAAAIVIRVITPDGAMDAAVAQTRALLARFAQGALTDEQAAQAFARRKDDRFAQAKEPRQRVLALFRDREPAPAETADALRTLGTRMWMDSRLVIVALRSRRER